MNGQLRLIERLREQGARAAERGDVVAVWNIGRRLLQERIRLLVLA